VRENTLKDKNVLITGATGGLGRAIALDLASKVNSLFLAGRNKTKLLELEEELFAKGKESRSFVADFCHDTAIVSLIEQVIDKDIDILINSAGIFPLKNIADSTLKDYNDCLNVNVKAPFLLSKILSEPMKEKRWGRIVNIGSSSSYNGSEDTGIYCTSKHALLGLTRSLYKELKDYDIRVYSVSPGSIQTEMGKTDTRQNFDTFLKPEEIAEYISFVLSFDKELVSEEIRLNRFVIE
jgi:short-subunit dehydrogenase